MRLLQITDCHFIAEERGKVQGLDTYRSLQAVFRAAAALADPPQAVLATGDLSEDGSDGSYRRLRRVLVESGLPVYAIPGNHDSKRAMRRLLIGEPVKSERCVDLGPWRLVFLDSTVDGEPYGYLDDAELRFLERALAEDTQRPALVCLHHSPTRPCPHRGCHLVNEDAFVALLDTYPNARVVLAGHSHLELERRTRHAVLFTTPATSAQCRHAQQGENVDHDDFWASHTFDPARQGFRMLSLGPGGEYDTEVHWIGRPP